MLHELALPDIDDLASPPFVIARISSPRVCAALGVPLHIAISALVAGMPVVIVQRDAHGDTRMFGDEGFVRRLPGLDLDAQNWVTFELPEYGDADPPVVALAA